jgi:hypothetical protein
MSGDLSDPVSTYFDGELLGQSRVRPPVPARSRLGRRGASSSSGRREPHPPPAAHRRPSRVKRPPLRGFERWLLNLSPTCRPDDPTPPDLTRPQPPSTEPNPKPITLREPCASRRSASVFRHSAGMVPFPAPQLSQSVPFPGERRGVTPGACCRGIMSASA